MPLPYFHCDVNQDGSRDDSRELSDLMVFEGFRMASLNLSIAAGQIEQFAKELEHRKHREQIYGLKVLATTNGHTVFHAAQGQYVVGSPQGERLAAVVGSWHGPTYKEVVFPNRFAANIWINKGADLGEMAQRFGTEVAWVTEDKLAKD
jgi:hypothetical protein